MAILVLMIGAPNVFAISDYQLGFNHGVSDGKETCREKCHWYIIQPGNGFINQTREFVKGYVAGFCNLPGNNESISDFEQASWNCAKGFDSANYYECGGNPDIVGPLYRPCP